MSVPAHVIVLGVREGRVTQDLPGFVRFTLGPSDLALYEWDASAADAGVPAEGSGFRGVQFHYLPETWDEVDAALRAAAAADVR